MERVPQKVLNWLHSVLIGVSFWFQLIDLSKLVQEYVDVNRTFSDVARSLEAYRSLRPSTDVYSIYTVNIFDGSWLTVLAFENGASSLLLHLTGTLPVSFRGNLYSFPVELWIPRSYPSEAPIALVIPTQEMVIRPGQHVSGEGRIYHPYLANWQPNVSGLMNCDCGHYAS
jgi:ESCRT-I complex subunit TSG101